jgi:hypothetical protein
MAKVAFSKKQTLFISKLDLNLRKKLVKYYIKSIDLCGVKTWTSTKIRQKYLGSLSV